MIWDGTVKKIRIKSVALTTAMNADRAPLPRFEGTGTFECYWEDPKDYESLILALEHQSPAVRLARPLDGN